VLRHRGNFTHTLKLSWITVSALVTQCGIELRMNHDLYSSKCEKMSKLERGNFATNYDRKETSFPHTEQ